MTARVPGSFALASYKSAEDLTLDELAARITAALPDVGSCSARTVQDLIRGARLPSLGMAAKISIATGIPPLSWVHGATSSRPRPE